MDLSQKQSQNLSILFGQNVRRIRLDQNLTITCVSNMSRIGRPLLLKIERGLSDVRLSYVERLADVLCVEPIELLLPHSAHAEGAGN